MGLRINQEAPDFEADTNHTVRNVFVIGPGKKIEPVVVIAGSVSNDEAKEIFGEWKSPKPYTRIVSRPR